MTLGGHSVEKPTSALGEGLGQEILEPGFSGHSLEGAVQASDSHNRWPHAHLALMGGCGLQG